MYGMNDPIALWKNNEVIEGHGRLQACIELGMKKVPCFWLNNLSDKQRREYMLVHNQTTMNTGWDFEKLEQELDELDFEGFDFGFEMNTIDESLLDDMFAKSEPKEKEPKQVQCPHCGEWFEV
jgi:ParB-like chromosome segregation protein Spo0J